MALLTNLVLSTDGDDIQAESPLVSALVQGTSDNAREEASNKRPVEDASE